MSGEEIQYDKLVIATGSTSVVPKWLKGTDLDNVFIIPKDKSYLDTMKEKIAELKKVIVIGAGFIGVEFSDELNKSGHQVTLIEKESSILAAAFDEEVSVKVREIIESRGVNVITGNGIKAIIGNSKVEKVQLENGEILVADAVILSMVIDPILHLRKNQKFMLMK